METKIVERRFEGIRVEVSSSHPYEEVLRRLRSLVGRSSLPEVLEVARSAKTAEEFAGEVQRRFVGPSGFILFNEYDHGAWIEKFGIHRKSMRWILGNPLYAITMIREDLQAGLFVPVELHVVDRGEGSMLTYVRPSSLIAIDNNKKLREAAVALDLKFAELIANATRQDS